MATITPAKYNPLTMAAPKAPVKLLPKKKVDFSSITPKVGVIDPLAQAKVGTKATGSYNITPSIQKWAVAKSASDIWKTKEVIVQQEKKQTNAIWELWSTVLANPDSSPAEIKAKFPEFNNIDEQVFWELWATILANPEISMEEIRQKFPELNRWYKAPVEKKWNVVGNVLWWALRSAVDLPQTISEMWLLNRPAEYLAWKIVWEDKLQSYKEKWGKPFSQVAKENVIWDPTSDLYQWTRAAWDVIQIGTSVAWALKSASKNAAKKNVLNIIKEWNTAANKRLAVREWRLTPAIKQSFFKTGKESVVQPTKKSIQATDTIVKLIKNPSKDPAKLFTQIDTKIGDISTQLAPKLKAIKVTENIWSNITKPIKELAKLTDEFTTTEISKMNWVISKLKKADNLDDVWKIRKEFDWMFSDAVKNATDLSAPTTRKANKLRTVVRNELNDKIDNIWSTISDVWAKKEFKTMSELYHWLSNITKRWAESNIVSKEIPSTLKNLLRKWAWYGGIWLAWYLWAKAWFKWVGWWSSYSNE